MINSKSNPQVLVAQPSIRSGFFFDELGRPQAKFFCADGREAKDATSHRRVRQRAFFDSSQIKAELRKAIGKTNVLIKAVW